MARDPALLLALIAALLPLPVPGQAQEIEEILDFDVTVDVRDGGVMTVREELRVRVLGHEIRRGIFRDIPTSFPRRFGLGRIEAPIEVVSVTRNGTPEPFTVETVGGPRGRGGMRIRIGNANVLLDHGVHDYAIVYRTSRWVEFGEGEDRLYWNVTGNDWSFPIRSATARIAVEGVTSRPEMEVWTGPEGSTEQSADVLWDASGPAAVFETRETLAPGEGMTVRVAFPSGLLAPPTEDQRSQWVRLDWGGWIDAGYVVLFVVAVYLLMWRKVGMDPAPGRTGIRDEPPEGYSPAALGFIEGRGYDRSLLSAALVNMALKGAIRIEQDDDSWTIERVREPDELDEPLSREESALFDGLVGSRGSIRLSRSNHQTLRSAIKAFRSSLSGRLEREYFENNRLWFALGLGVSILGFAALAWRWRFDVNPVALFLGFWLTGWSFGVGTLGYRLVQQLRAARRGGGAAIWAGVGFMALFSIPFFVAEVVVAGILFTMVPVHLVVAALAIGGTNVLFYHLLERPTLKGRGVLDELDAFRAHLDRAVDGAQRGGLMAEDRLRRYERVLPFAIALAMEERWTSAFEDVLAGAFAGAATASAFPWYVHRGNGTSAPSSFASDLGAGLSSRLSAMSSPPSSSGGGGGFSGGGGSSGGGGGGGGGGGW